MAHLIDHIRQAFENSGGGDGSNSSTATGTTTSTGSTTIWPSSSFFLSSLGSSSTSVATSSTPTTTSAVFLHNLFVVVACVLFYKCIIEYSCWLRSRSTSEVSDIMDGRTIIPDDNDINNTSSGSSGGGVASNSTPTTTPSSISISTAHSQQIHVGHYTRSMLHIGLSSSMVLFWPYLDVSDGWSWKLIALLPITVMSRLFYKAVIVRNPQDEDVQNHSVCNSPSDLLWGPFFHAGVMVWLTFQRFMTHEAAVIAAATVGDGLAPIIGQRYGRHIYTFPWTKRLTVEGSVVGVLLGTVVGSYTFQTMMGLELLPLRMILMYASIATVAESSSIAVLDNLIVPIMIHLCMEPVQSWL